MNRVGAPALGADKLGPMPGVARELQALPIDEALFQARTHQAAVMRNTIERAEFVGAHVVTGRQMTAEMLEALAASRAHDALAIEPCVHFRDRMKLTGVNLCLSLVRIAKQFAGSVLLMRSGRARAASLANENLLSIRQTHGDPKSSPGQRWTRIYFRFRKRTTILSSNFAAS